LTAIDTCDQLRVAQEIIAKIRRLLLSNNKKGAEMRTKLGLKGWRELGKSELDEDVFEEVQILLQAGVKPNEAVALVAENTGISASQVKTSHWRIKAKRQRDLEDAAQAAGVRPLEIQEALKKGELVTGSSQ